MKKSVAFVLLLSTLLVSCGGNYQITRAGNGVVYKGDFDNDERVCNQTNFFVPQSSKDKKDQTIYMSLVFLNCMRDKGWNFKLTERKLSWIKSVRLD